MAWNCAPQFFMHISSATRASICLTGLARFVTLSLSALTVSLPWR